MSHMEGQIWLLTRSLQLTSFQAYKLRVTHLFQLKQHSILVSVGQDEQGINPLVSVAAYIRNTNLFFFSVLCTQRDRRSASGAPLKLK